MGVAGAGAKSGSVSVLSSTELEVTLASEETEKNKHKNKGLDAKGDGIKATSAAVAGAQLNQTAGQENANNATAIADTGICKAEPGCSTPNKHKHPDDCHCASECNLWIRLGR